MGWSLLYGKQVWVVQPLLTYKKGEQLDEVPSQSLGTGSAPLVLQADRRRIALNPCAVLVTELANLEMS